MDPSVSPCDDFYQYACGGWLRTAAIPAQAVSFNPVADAVYDGNQAILRSILERDAGGIGDGPYARELGALYGTCMDQAAIEKAGLGPLDDELTAIASVHDARSLSKELAHLHGGSLRIAFEFDADIDARDSTHVIAVMSQDGLGLPDREYYFPQRSDDEKQKLRAAYEVHVAATLALGGETPDDAKKHAARVVSLETQLASASMSSADLQDPQKTYHKLDRAALTALAPDLAWDEYFAELGLQAVGSINVAEPEYIMAVSAMVRSRPIEDWRLFLRWRVLDLSSPALPARFVDEHFQWEQALTGVREQTPRWKRCVAIADRLMGDALAQPFVTQTLGNDGKRVALEVVRAVEDSMRAKLSAAAWLDEATRARALDKLAGVHNKIGYPDTWRSYDGIGMDRTSYFANRARGYAFDAKRRFARIGKQVDRDEWPVTPPTVDAFYLPTGNEIIFPAGILQRPLFAPGQPPAMNFGGTGVSVGHEITHGFDNEGRQFDADGNLKDWWSPGVSAEFEKRATCFVDQYGSYVAIDQKHLDGKLTLAENIADNVGLKLAYSAFEVHRAAHPAPQPSALSPERQFFIAHAQAWCELLRDDFVRLIVTTDPHAPARFRINGSVSNTKEFADAFGCKPGDRMVRAQRCELW